MEALKQLMLPFLLSILLSQVDLNVCFPPNYELRYMSQTYKHGDTTAAWLGIADDMSESRVA